MTHFAGFIFDSARRQVTRATAEPVHLTPKAFDLLALLIRRSAACRPEDRDSRALVARSVRDRCGARRARQGAAPIA